MNDYTLYLLSLTVAQFRAFKRAVQTLTRAGIPLLTAVEMIATAAQNRVAPRDYHKIAR